MTFKESIPVAKQLAERALEKGFDVEAFLILAEINKMSEEERVYASTVDNIPNSTIDEGINYLLSLYIEYVKDRRTETYVSFLNVLEQILSELYHTTTNIFQQEEFKKFLSKCNDII